jgi:hypothetical protein
MSSQAVKFKIPISGDRYVETAADAVRHVEEGLQLTGWQGKEGGAGWAMVRLFGRLIELLINRIDQVPDKHFLGFLNQAGVEPLPARPAVAELTFTPAEKGVDFVRVPSGVQVATVQTEDQPEVVFETQRDIVVSPARLMECIAFDHLAWSDRTAESTGKKVGKFAAFQGELERKRILYLSDAGLLAFEDEASRLAATISLSFTLTKPGDPEADGDWELEWLTWDGSAWVGLGAKGAVVGDDTEGLSKNGEVRLSHLPQMVETQEIDGESRIWLGCELKGGTSRNYLPQILSVHGSRTITDLSGSATADGALSALQSGTAFVALDPGKEFFPLGQRPGRLDGFYLCANEPFSKSGATVTILLTLVGVTETPADTSQLERLEVEWAYHSTDGWLTLGSSGWGQSAESAASSILGFKDKTEGFTKSGSGPDHYVQFTVPPQEGGQPLFAKTKVNEVEGYWIRAQIRQGSYDVPGKMEPITRGSDTERWVEPKTYPPLIRSLQIDYSGYSEPATLPQPVERCRSQVDVMWRDHLPSMSAGKSWAPFSAAEEGPALYLGFNRPFPVGEWNQLLVDVAEGQIDVSNRRPVFWEYWNGSRWPGLRVSDGTGGLNERGYLGFFGPRDHCQSSEFGRQAYWLRARPHLLPLADSGSEQTIQTGNDESRVTLNGSSSRSLDARRTISRYIWRLVSSTPPVADAGPDRTMLTGEREATLELDASASREAHPGRPIVKYLWRLREPEKEEESKPTAGVHLQGILVNTVPAVNSVTIRDEVLGSSDGRPDQVLVLQRSPVLPGAQIAVREADRPPEQELIQLQKELRQDGVTAQDPLVSAEATPGEGVWVHWRQVLDFYDSGPSSRHFTLDPATGLVRFGDGKQGKIPQVGRDNVKGVYYRTHDGAKGNAKAGTITALRNPSGDLANIKSVTNPEEAAGGSDGESVAELRRRGPQRLKSRDRAVSGEDYIALALEASGEVAQAYCLPTRNKLGLKEPGWVTVVITPKSEAAKPAPSPTLLRLVQGHLESHCLTNLQAVNHIHVTGPEYVEATVLARIVPTQPEKSDEIELAVLERLETFLHPLRGGPDRTGWQLGRDLYLSEVYAEIEDVAGVDHAGTVRLLGSIQQFRLRIEQEEEGYRKIPFTLPVGSQVSTFDERIKLILAEAILGEQQDDGEGGLLKRVDVYAFKVGDQVAVVSASNAVIKDNLTIASLSGTTLSFDYGFEPPINWDQAAGLMSADGRLRLVLAPDGAEMDTEGKVVEVEVQGFVPGEKISLVSGGKRHPALEFLPVAAVEPCEDRVIVPEGHLIYSGSHDIEMVVE